ncbi:MAG: non-homologous end-joining DNA ligase [Candidatus Eremiobacteraeota bacterium]|nr:non-homologous end-joining DNA ligase [Candidatus Eremiobacteraeota bacterium]
MAARTTQKTSVAGRELTFSNLDKVLFPEDGYTKGDLIAYYLSVAKWLVPHLRDRPLTLERYPDGIDGGSFFEKQAPRFKPAWIPAISLAAEQNTRKIAYMVCNDEPALAWCANLASITLHVWYSHVPTLDEPDYALFDLDPWEGCTMKTLAAVALAFRESLEAIGLHPLVKTSGGTGLHVVVPLRPQYSYEAVKQFAELVARRIAAQLPRVTTLERAISKRPKGAVYLDWVQVGKGKTVVPPFVVRARRKAPVSMPLHWSEVESLAAKRGGDPVATVATWNITNAAARLKREGDLWAGKAWRATALEPALKKAARAWA